LAHGPQENAFSAATRGEKAHDDYDLARGIRGGAFVDSTITGSKDAGTATAAVCLILALLVAV